MFIILVATLLIIYGSITCNPLAISIGLLLIIIKCPGFTLGGKSQTNSVDPPYISRLDEIAKDQGKSIIFIENSIVFKWADGYWAGVERINGLGDITHASDFSDDTLNNAIRTFYSNLPSSSDDIGGSESQININGQRMLNAISGNLYATLEDLLRMPKIKYRRRGIFGRLFS